ncbi:hypothetical protein GCM10011613_28760 [Cellvibrio zantedeschiae]|uniref:Capsule synthesis protein CapA domain-containing protein n=1 Tax=Cellvibrio zantedeschiae TaxID=1237077 RepID=A0ABQ3B6L6_9GAMM|nr:CapA family protein [Cellvibrio zantedeschiae]GGY82252.1 hypothetical protein GCM10011613_28760 [Cellvibrio zantedeschiae]
MKLMFVGDINPGEYYTSIGNGPRSLMKSKDPLAALHALFHQADAVIGNLEAPVSHTINENGTLNSLTLIGHAPDLKYFADANFKYLQISNNHIVQHGLEIFQETLTSLSNHKITALGLKDQPMELFTSNGITVGMLSASDIPDNTYKNQQSYQRFDDDFLTTVKQSVPLVDHLIVLMHWGSEDSTKPNERQRTICQQLKTLGVRAVIGSHTHLFYEVEKTDNFICAYSLGNFIFDLAWDKRLLKSGILEVNFTKDGLSGKVHPVELKENGCIPHLTSAPVNIDKVTALYNHGDSMEYQQLKKTLYLIKNILKGRTGLKFSFFFQKLTKFSRRK